MNWINKLLNVGQSVSESIKPIALNVKERLSQNKSIRLARNKTREIRHNIKQLRLQARMQRVQQKVAKRMTIFFKRYKS